MRSNGRWYVWPTSVLSGPELAKVAIRVVSVPGGKAA